VPLLVSSPTENWIRLFVGEDTNEGVWVGVSTNKGILLLNNIEAALYKLAQLFS